MSLLLALFAALAAASPASAQEPRAESAAACFAQAARQPPAALDVVVSAYPTVFERRLSIMEINHVRPVRLPPQAIAHGLSMVDFNVRSKVKSEAITWGPDGRVCAWVGKVTVDLTPQPIRVYIPKEYRPGTCESNVLSLHELEHEELYRRALLRAADAVRFALTHDRELAGPRSAIDAAGFDEASALFKRKVEALVRPIFADLVKTSRTEQDSLDNPETYSRLGDSCSGWKRT